MSNLGVSVCCPGITVECPEAEASFHVKFPHLVP